MIRTPRDLSPRWPVLLLAASLSLAAQPSLAADETEAAPKGAAVTVLKATKSCFSNIVEVSGTLIPRDETQVRPERMGLKVAEVLADAGDTVTAGQTLARLNLPDGGGTALVQAPIAGLISSSTAVVGAMASGKGEALWRSLAATSGDIIAFVDSDLIDPDPMFVPKLVGPLLTADGVHLVKAFYRRPLKVSGREDANGGGRVTQLVARPLLAALRPELSGVLQPLGGEYAGTRALLTSVPFAPGYGVEIGLLIDTYDRLGLEAIAQVNLGVRAHRNRPLTELSAMSRQVVATLLSRCGVTDSGVGLTQFFADGAGFTPRISSVSLDDRPPMNTLHPR